MRRRDVVGGQSGWAVVLRWAPSDAECAECFFGPQCRNNAELDVVNWLALFRVVRQLARGVWRVADGWLEYVGL